MRQSRHMYPFPDAESGISSCIEYTSMNDATNNKIYKTEILQAQKIQHKKTNRMMYGYGVI